MPQPRKNEKEQEFIDRCMDSEEMKRQFPDENQRLAVCSNYWEDDKPE